MTQQQPETLQTEPAGDGWGTETYALTEVGEAAVAKPRAELPPLALPADAQSAAVWMMRDAEEGMVAAMVEVTGADGQVIGRWGYLSLEGNPHPKTVQARATELGLRLIAGGTTRGMCINGVAAELDPELLTFAISVDDMFDADGFFVGRGAGFAPATDEAETDRRRAVCNDHLRATPEE